MASSTITRKNATIARWGNSQGVRIPKEFLACANISEDDPIELIVTSSAIVIKRTVKPKVFDDLFTGFKGSYDMGEVDWGSSMGNEEW